MLVLAAAQSHYFMANRLGKVETVTNFIFLGYKITAATKLRHLLLGRKAMTNLDSILNSRHITWQTKVGIVKVMAFPTCMDVRVGPSRRLSTKELILLNCGAGEDS